MLQTLTMHSLKEWAVAIKAIDAGRQILLLRKGGIREKEFKIEHEEFLLYPTFEHQKAELLKSEYHAGLRETLEPWGGEPQRETPASVTFTHLAQVRQVIEISDPEKLAALSPYHIWTGDYAEQRLHWRPRKPLEIVLIMAQRLEHPVVAPVHAHYHGCKSWVDLDDGIPTGALAPVISEVEFENLARQIREALN
ncbi:MAG: DUF1802 family protein [Dehalococcoidia bacterium]|nr:DUF1802 family protein [Dehalococcoidia bacterium]